MNIYINEYEEYKDLKILFQDIGVEEKSNYDSIKAKFLVPLLILFDLFFGFTSYSVVPIAHFAHIGGAITGLLMMLYWKKSQFNNRRWN